MTCKLLVDSIFLLYHILEEKGGMSVFDEEWIVNSPSRLRIGPSTKGYMYSRFRIIVIK